MDLKSYRCTYDPELSRSKSQGNKPIICRSRLEQKSTDPRLNLENVGKCTKLKLKRINPRERLPLPHFSLSLMPPKSCLVTRLNPLVTRSKLFDMLTKYGQIDSCQIIYSEATGASLGIASVTFTDQGSTKLVKDCIAGRCTIDGVAVRAEFDRNGELLAKARKEAENSRTTSDIGLNSVVDDLNAFETRQLNHTQTQIWYNKFLGVSPTYLLILSKCLSVHDYSLSEVARLFKGTGYRSVVGNRSGFYTTYNNEFDALKAYKKIHLSQAMGTIIRLEVTVDGKHVTSQEVLQLFKKHGISETNPHEFNVQTTQPKLPGSLFNSASLSASKTIRPDFNMRDTHIPPGILWAAAKQTLEKVIIHLKSQLWEQRLSNFSCSIIERELKKVKESQINGSSKVSVHEQYNGNIDGPYVGDTQPKNFCGSPQDLLSNPISNPNIKPIGFGVGSRHTSHLSKTSRSRNGTVGVNYQPQLTSTPNNGVSVFNSYLGMPRIKKRHQDGFQASKSSIIRGSFTNIAGMAKADADSITATEEESDGVATDHSSRLKPKKSLINDNEMSDNQSESDSDMDVAFVSQDNEDGNQTTVNIDISELDFEKEENTIDIIDLQLPTGSTMPDKITFNSIRRLVRSLADFKELKLQLDNAQSSNSASLSESELVDRLVKVEKIGLRLNEDTWLPPENEPPFRFCPFRERKHSERCNYLPYYGPGVPTEIVQNNKRRMLYEEILEEPTENADARKESKAINMSLNAFGSNADLFAEDNLSKNAKATRLARSSIHEWGLYADERIPSNEFVIEYVGDVLRDEFAEIRERHYALEGIDSTYLFRLDNGTVIDATKRGNGARFINHSCDPNCTAQVFDHDGYKRVVLFSLKNINPDEELTFDYNFALSQDENGKVRCACGAANCRGWLM